MGRDTWIDILLSPDVAYGRSDPNADPCGYRSVLTIALAEKHYARLGLAERLLGKDWRHIRPKETDLLALLEAGAIDYVFIYRSVAQQHHLEYLVLPDEINLKEPRLSEDYWRATVRISGKKPGETITTHGEPMVYGVTIPEKAPNPEAALAFVQFLLSEDGGRAILERNGQPSAVPAPSRSFDAIPLPLRKYATSAGEGQALSEGSQP